MRFTQNPHSHFSFTFSSISPLSFLLSLSSSFLFLPDSLFCQKYIQFYDRTIRGEITTYSIYIRYFHFDVAIHTSATRAVDRFLYTQLTSRHFPQSVILFGVRSFEGNMHIHSPTWLRVADSLLYTGENVEVLNACVPQQTGNEFHIINTVTWKRTVVVEDVCDKWQIAVFHQVAVDTDDWKSLDFLIVLSKVSYFRFQCRRSHLPYADLHLLLTLTYLC